MYIKQAVRRLVRSLLTVCDIDVFVFSCVGHTPLLILIHLGLPLQTSLLYWAKHYAKYQSHCPTVRYRNILLLYFIACRWRLAIYIWRSCIPVGLHVGLMRWKCANFEHWSELRSEINRSYELRSICRLCCRCFYRCLWHLTCMQRWRRCNNFNGLDSTTSATI